MGEEWLVKLVPSHLRPLLLPLEVERKRQGLVGVRSLWPWHRRRERMRRWVRIEKKKVQKIGRTPRTKKGLSGIDREVKLGGLEGDLKAIFPLA
jgi:hypothetical protein